MKFLLITGKKVYFYILISGFLIIVLSQKFDVRARTSLTFDNIPSRLEKLYHPCKHVRVYIPQNALLNFTPGIRKTLFNATQTFDHIWFNMSNPVPRSNDAWRLQYIRTFNGGESPFILQLSIKEPQTCTTALLASDWWDCSARLRLMTVIGHLAYKLS